MPIEFVVTAPKKIHFRDYADLPLQPDEVRVRSIVSGIKLGTEMALYSGESPFVDQQFDLDLRLFRPSPGKGLYPCNLGSWLAGEVVETGSAVQQFQVGDRVHGGLPHRPTNICKAGDLHWLKADFSPERALFTDPAIFALQAVHDAQIKVGDEVAIFGMGALGLLAIQIARMNGAGHVYAVDVLPGRLALASELGADLSLDAAACDPGFELKQLTRGKGVDVAIEISGAYSALQSAIRAVHPGGLLVTASYFKGNGSELSLGAEWHHNRLTLISSMPVWGMPHRSYPMWDLKRIECTALGLLESGRLTVDPLVSKRYPYSQAVEAYRSIDERPGDVVKVLLDYE
jgi:threonine dehydrogenase-like Zn-dependent dehydrogenase